MLEYFDMVHSTPVEKYKLKGTQILVKREDLCISPPGPPFSKLRGLWAHLSMLKAKGTKTVGYAESAISMAGWGVAWACDQLGMEAVIFDPQYTNETPELLKTHRIEWMKHKPTIVHVPSGRTSVNHWNGAKWLQKNRKHAVMLPIGLRLPETVYQTAQEYSKTIQQLGFRPSTVIVCVGSGTIAAGIVRQAATERVIGVTAYTQNIKRKRNKILGKAGRTLSRGLYPVHFDLVPFGGEYTTPSHHPCPFPCHSYYDRKAWEWLTYNKTDLKRPILFWNIGGDYEIL